MRWPHICQQLKSATSAVMNAADWGALGRQLVLGPDCDQGEPGACPEMQLVSTKVSCLCQRLLACKVSPPDMPGLPAGSQISWVLPCRAIIPYITGLIVNLAVCCWATRIGSFSFTCHVPHPCPCLGLKRDAGAESSSKNWKMRSFPLRQFHKNPNDSLPLKVYPEPDTFALSQQELKWA